MSDTNGDVASARAGERAWLEHVLDKEVEITLVTGKTIEGKLLRIEDECFVVVADYKAYQRRGVSLLVYRHAVAAIEAKPR